MRQETGFDTRLSSFFSSSLWKTQKQPEAKRKIAANWFLVLIFIRLKRRDRRKFTSTVRETKKLLHRFCFSYTGNTFFEAKSTFLFVFLGILFFVIPNRIFVEHEVLNEKLSVELTRILIALSKKRDFKHSFLVKKVSSHSPAKWRLMMQVCKVNSFLKQTAADETHASEMAPSFDWCLHPIPKNSMSAVSLRRHPFVLGRRR